MKEENRKYVWIAVMFLIVAAIVILVIVQAKRPAGPNFCKDKIDNDGDGFIDMSDAGCINGRDKSETNLAVACDDALDNDGDGTYDMDDDGCMNITDTAEDDCGDSVVSGSEVCEIGGSQTCTTSKEYSGRQFCISQGNGWYTCTKTQNCGDGICTAGAESIYTCTADCGFPNSCFDSDASATTDYTTSGAVSGRLNNLTYSINDSCAAIGLTEYSCNGNISTSRNVNCIEFGYNTCVNGACA